MGLKGTFEELPLAELIEMTALGGKTGRLSVFDETGAAAGRLAFRAGRLVSAICGALTAEKAFYALLQLKAGSFDFDPEAEPDDETCDLSTASLLMEGMRRIDEVRELRRSMPAPATVRLMAGEAEDGVEARVLGYLGPGARTVGDIVDGMLVAGEIDEYDALHALARLRKRAVVRVDVSPGLRTELGPSGLPQPELER